MPLVLKPGQRRRAAVRRLRRKALRWLMLVAVIILAAYALNFFYSFGTYQPELDEPKDLDRDQVLRPADGQ